MKAKILVIDDDEQVQYVFSNYLEREGYEVSTAEDYHSAIELISSVNFDLILVDIFLL